MSDLGNKHASLQESPPYLWFGRLCAGRIFIRCILSKMTWPKASYAQIWLISDPVLFSVRASQFKLCACLKSPDKNESEHQQWDKQVLKKRVQKGSVRNSNLCRLSLCYSCLSSYSFGEDRQGYLPYSRMAEEKKQETHLSILLVHFGKNVFKHVISNRHLFLSNFEKLLHFFYPHIKE